jgi:hypothetical protein
MTLSLSLFANLNLHLLTRELIQNFVPTRGHSRPPNQQGGASAKQGVDSKATASLSNKTKASEAYSSNSLIPVAKSKLPIQHRGRTLRVVRVVERGQRNSQVGRMVISGRMADVCAEIDRLAAFESA